MTYEDRKRIALELLVDFLGSFVAPRGLDDDAMQKCLHNISEAFARRMPVCGEEEYRGGVDRVFVSVRDTHKGYAWPAQEEFVAVMPKGTVTGGAPETFKPASDFDTIAKRMRNGEGVPERFVWGTASQQLISSGLVAHDKMDEYRRASVEQYRHVYRSEAAKVMDRKCGSQCAPYLQKQKEAGQ